MVVQRNFNFDIVFMGILSIMLLLQLEQVLHYEVDLFMIEIVLNFIEVFQIGIIGHI